MRLASCCFLRIDQWGNLEASHTQFETPDQPCSEPTVKDSLRGGGHFICLVGAFLSSRDARRDRSEGRLEWRGDGPTSKLTASCFLCSSASRGAAGNGNGRSGSGVVSLEIDSVSASWSSNCSCSCSFWKKGSSMMLMKESRNVGDGRLDIPETGLEFAVVAEKAGDRKLDELWSKRDGGELLF